MRIRTGAAIAGAGAIAAGAALAVVLSSSDDPAPRPAADSDSETRVSSSATRFGGARADCSMRSEASFSGGFTSPRNLVVDPLVLVGGAYTNAATVREFGGNKFPVLVKAGHSVTVRVARRWRRVAGLGYGRLPQGKNTFRDTHRSVTFVACQQDKPPRQYSASGRSGSYADGVAVTFWSGFIAARTPACIPLEVYVDGAAAPRRVGLALGRRCEP